MKLIRLLSVSLVALVVLAACGSEKDPLAPPSINYGVDMSEMGMPVVDERFTVATLPTGTSDWLLFDDIGEFLKYHQQKSDDFQVMWVPDHDTKKWMKAEDAFYVQSDEFCYSPMRWCVAAFATEDSASSALDKFGGDIWNWENIFEADWSQAPMPMDHDDHDMHGDSAATPDATSADHGPTDLTGDDEAEH